MLSSSQPKIHEPLVTGVSPRPTDWRAAPGKLRNTRAPVSAENYVTVPDQHLSAGQPSPSPSSATPA